MAKILINGAGIGGLTTFNLPRERVRQLRYKSATKKYEVPVIWGKQMTHFEQSPNCD